MVDNNQKNKSISVENYGIENAKVKYQLSSEELHNEILVKGQGKEASSGAIAVNTGEFTGRSPRSEEHTSELQSRPHLVCRLLLEKKKKKNITQQRTVMR